MDFKRIASALLGFPVVVAILVLANQYIVDIVIGAVALIAMNEFYNAVAKESKPVRWIGYLSCISIAFIHIIPIDYLSMLILLVIPGIILL